MTIKISITRPMRDFSSGWEMDAVQEFHLSVAEAESIVRQINAQLPAEKELLERERQNEIGDLKRRLAVLEGGDHAA